MSEEEKDSIEILENTDLDINTIDGVDLHTYNYAVKTVLNLIQKQQKEIEKLEDKNKELLRKLRNRVKEVNKLIKYSMYKKEFSTLNARLKKKDKIIDEMIQEYEYNARINLKNFCDEEMRKDKCIQDCRACVKQYFENKAKEK